jgi:NADH dehydrogenase
MRTNFFGNEEVKKYSFPLKSIPDALNFRSHLMQLMEAATISKDASTQEKLMTLVVGGGGPTGVEMAGALSELRKYVLPKDYPALDFSKMKIYLVEGGDRLLPPMSPKSSDSAKRDLEKMGIILKLNELVTGYDGKTVTLKSGEKIDSYTMIWSAGVMAEPVTGIKKEWTERGRILIDEYCKVKGSNNIYAIGDIALMKTEEYPKGLPGVAQPAIQMGEYVGKNLAAFHKGNTSIKTFKYFDKGSLATIGRGKAVADLPHNLHFGGRPAWWIWLFVHISFLISFRNKLLVFTNWMWNYFTYDKGNRLIIRPYVRKGDEAAKQVFAEEEAEA